MVLTTVDTRRWFVRCRQMPTIAITLAATLAVTLGDVFGWLVTVVAMAAVGFGVWKLVQRQEAADPKFRQKLDADDARARRNSET